MLPPVIAFFSHAQIAAAQKRLVRRQRFFVNTFYSYYLIFRQKNIFFQIFKLSSYTKINDTFGFYKPQKIKRKQR